MKADNQALADVLRSAKRFVIPEFQRPYCWTKEEVEQLWNDLYGAYCDYKEKGCPETGEEYFVGPVVVAMGTEDRTHAKIANVVDGQQRLTVLHALLWCAYHRLQNESSVEAKELCGEIERLLLTTGRQATLAVAREDQANFLSLQEQAQLDESRELGVAGAFFREKIAAHGDLSDFIAFMNYVLNHAVFVLVQTDSYDDAWDLFIGLNSKGKPLEPTDLIKAYICGTSEDSMAMANVWQEKVVPLRGATVSAAASTVSVGVGQFPTEARLFPIFKDAWQEKKVTPSLLGGGCDTFRRYWQMPLDEVPGLHDGKRALRGLRALNRTDHTPIIIAYGAKYGMTKVFRAELLRMFEAYQYWMAIRGKHGRARNFANLANAVYAGQLSENEALSKIIELLKQLVPPRDEVREAVRKSAYRGRVMLFTVRSHEEGMRGDVEVDDVWYEHLMPQTATDYWYDKAGTRDASSYNHIINNIGNVMCLDPKTNIRGSNDPWDKKRQLYRNEVPNWLVADVARNNSEWTPEKIAERAEAIADWAVGTRWDFEDAMKRVRTPA